MSQLPEAGYCRLVQIIGDAKRGIPAVISVSKSAWWSDCKSGRFPAPVKLRPLTTRHTSMMEVM